MLNNDAVIILFYSFVLSLGYYFFFWVRKWNQNNLTKRLAVILFFIFIGSGIWFFNFYKNKDAPPLAAKENRFETNTDTAQRVAYKDTNQPIFSPTEQKLTKPKKKVAQKNNTGDSSNNGVERNNSTQIAVKNNTGVKNQVNGINNGINGDVNINRQYEFNDQDGNSLLEYIDSLQKATNTNIKCAKIVDYGVMRPDLINSINNFMNNKGYNSSIYMITGDYHNLHGVDVKIQNDCIFIRVGILPTI